MLRFIACPRSVYFRVLIMIAYDTGLRRCDLLRITREQIDADGRFVLVQRKTKWPVLCQVGQDTLQAIDASLLYPRKCIFGGVNIGFIGEQFRAIVKAAGLKGSLTKLRKTSVTAMEGIMPGSGQEHLGHKYGDTTRRFYIDPRLIGSKRPLPPRLTDKPEAEGGTQ